MLGKNLNTALQDIEQIKHQEEVLCFLNFDAELAWRIGSRLRELACERGLVVAIEIKFHGQPLFYTALDGTAPDHCDWLRRKSNTVLRFHKSSYRMGLELQQQDTNLMQKLGLELCDYSTHGGCFPIRLQGAQKNNAIVIGSIAVSGLPQRADHELVIEVLAEVLGHAYVDLSLSSQ